MTGQKCPCGSGAAFDTCCGPILSGSPAPTAEALMRSRYTAFVRGDAAFIARTYATEHRASVGGDLPAVEWTGLKIMGKSGGGIADTTGTVDFVASYRQDGKIHMQRENSTFRRENGNWVYVDGLVARQAGTISGGKTGRNDPCPCGSGRKFKKCCGVR